MRTGIISLRDRDECRLVTSDAVTNVAVISDARDECRVTNIAVTNITVTKVIEPILDVRA